MRRMGLDPRPPEEHGLGARGLRERVEGTVRDGLVDDALATWESIPATDWFPGIPLTPRLA